MIVEINLKNEQGINSGLITATCTLVKPMASLGAKSI
jgi:hypothetical protein